MVTEGRVPHDSLAERGARVGPARPVDQPAQGVEDPASQDEDQFGDPLRRGRSVRVTDAEGWASGRAAADLASLHNHAPVRQ